ncbi:MAG: hypothetical protein FJ387_17250 [Verrucomicrobia bacterium]|nr:hypothetical protein [Verrucomicrobiota bacterium]
MKRPDLPSLAARGRERLSQRTVFGLLVAVGHLFSSALTAQVSGVNWYTVDGGGGTSSGGGFSVSGTIGQPDAGELLGGSFEVCGGVWGLVEVIQTPGAPQLSVSREAGSGVVTISWTLPDEGWVLHENSILGQPSTPWVLVAPATYQNNATHRFITIPNPAGTRFFRLQRS